MTYDPVFPKLTGSLVQLESQLSLGLKFGIWS